MNNSRSVERSPSAFGAVRADPRIGQAATRNTGDPNLSQKRVSLSLSRFKDISDVDFIKLELRRGNIVFLDVNDFIRRESNEVLDLKRAIDQIRGFCNEIGGDIGRVGDSLLIITPNNRIKIF